MTLEEATKSFGVPFDKLKQYVSSGFIREVNGTYLEEDFERLGLVETLLSAGLSLDEAKAYLSLADRKGTEEEQIRQLRQLRRKILDGIHENQQLLDRIDYLIRSKQC